MSLLKLVVVEDEPILLKGLIETYGWEQMGYTIVASARSGEEAIHVINQEKPDVVLSDIRMKKIDGLMVMEQIKRSHPDIQFVFISAYRDFEYAQKAIKIGAYAYLLKPIDEKQLVETMLEIKKEYLLKRESLEEKANWKRILLENEDNFLQVILKKHLEKQIDLSRLMEVFSALNFQIEDTDIFITICADIEISQKITKPLQFEADKISLKQSIKNLLEAYKYDFWYFENENGNLIFVIWAKQDLRSMTIKKMMKNVKISQGMLISVVSKEYYGLENLIESYEEAMHLFEKSPIAKAYTPSNDVGIKENQKIYEKSGLLIRNVIRKNDEEELKKLFDEFINNTPNDEKFKKIVLTQLLVQIEILLIETYGLTEQVAESFDRYFKSQAKLSSNQAVDISYQLLLLIIEERKKLSSKENEIYPVDYMSVAMAYIDENLGDSTLSIVNVASVIYLNPVYFGRVFKNVYNMTFKQFLMKQRMEKAQKLILEGEESMTVVCEKVGISNPSYFSQLFKQYTGKIPSEFKRDHL